MRLQFAEFIAKGDGATVSEPVENALDANIIYMSVISEDTPGVTVEVLTDGEPDTGTWLDGTIMTPGGTEVSAADETGLYYVKIAGARYIRVKNTSEDDTLEVFGAFDRICVAD